MLYKTTKNTPIGNITLCSDGKSIAGLWIENQKYFAQTAKEEMIENADLAVFERAIDWLNRYFAGEMPDISEIPLSPEGSEFRKAVWKVLCAIPYAKVTTYGEIARKISAETGKKTSARAVGGAVGHNPISIIIPCHRVIGANGNLTGYAGGIGLKVRLLEHEKANLSDFFRFNY